MTQMDIAKKIDALSNDPAFAERFAECASADEMAALLLSEGIEISSSELSELLASVAAMNSDELSEDSLDTVSGGALIGAGVVAYAVYKLLKKKGGFGGGAGGGGFR